MYGAIIGAAASLASTAISNSYARSNYDSASSTNFKYGEMSAENAYLRQQHYYNNYLSPSAQLEQLRKAGLSPGLIYSHGLLGSSGSSVPQGSGASGNQPQSFPVDLLGNALALAQIKNINADTKKKEEEAVNLGQQTTNLKSEQQKLIQEIGNLASQQEYVRAQRRLIDLQSDFQSITNKYQDKLSEYQLNKLDAETKYYNEQVNALLLSNEITDASKQELIKQVQLQNGLLTAQRASQFSQVKLSDAQIFKMQHDIVQGYQDITLKAKSVKNDNERVALAKREADLLAQRINNEYQLGLDKNRLDAMSQPLYSSYLLFMQYDPNFEEIESIIHKQ